MDRIRGLLFGAFIGDAFALPAHWIYDTELVAQNFGAYDHYLPVAHHMFHGQKRAGSFTHYGDQATLLLRSIASTHGFQLGGYKSHWLNMMKTYEGYHDKAMKESMPQLKSGVSTGSPSDDLGGFSVCAPLIAYHFDDVGLFEHLDAAIRMTHDSPELLEISDFLTKILLDLVVGNDFLSTFEHLAEANPQYKLWYQDALAHSRGDCIQTVKQIGQSCSCQFAFPSALAIAIKYSEDFLGAMQANVLCGGDSAARGMVIGMLLGAHLGIQRLPKVLVTELENYELLMQFTEHARV